MIPVFLSEVRKRHEENKHDSACMVKWFVVAAVAVVS